MFKVQDAQELNHPEKASSTLVKHLYGLVDKLNDTETQMIGMSPKDAIKLKEVNLVENYPPEDTLPDAPVIVLTLGGTQDRPGEICHFEKQKGKFPILGQD